ncbi:hypothetical protein JCM10213_003226 [Rhodosporidiobolus nylandii]
MEPLLPRTLIIDFHDSYTRNLLALVAQHLAHLDFEAPPGDADAAALWDCKGWQERVVVVNVDDWSWDSFLTDILPHLDCVVLGPGPGTPHNPGDFSWPQRLLKEVGDRLPIFGLCLGCQGLATAFGGKVVKAASPKHGQISAIRLAGPPPASSTASSSHTNRPTTIFDGLPSPFSAVQYNSLVVDPTSLPDELEVLAWTEGKNGSDEVMALRHREKPLWGVQFHPESIESTYGARILSNFFSLALAFHASHAFPSSPRSPSDPLPSRILALSTSLRPSVSPNQVPHSSWPGEMRWEQRTVKLAGLAVGWTPQRVFEALVKGKSRLGEVWLDSARPAAEPQYSHLVVPRATWSYSVARDELVIRASASSVDSASDVTTRTLPLSSSLLRANPNNFFSLLSASHSHLQRHTLVPSSSSSIPIPLGFVGYFGYEMKDVALPLSRRVMMPEELELEKEEGRADAELALAEAVLSYEHEAGEWWASGLIRRADAPPSDGPAAASLVDDFGVSEQDWASWLAQVQATLRWPPSLPSPTPASLPTPLNPRQTRESYLSSIAASQSLIRGGDTYELCLTTSFYATLPSPPQPADEPYALYLSLRASNPAPYSAFFRLPLSGTPAEVANGGLALLSSSPERFLRISASGKACMKPIKGTARRSADPEEDRRRREALQADEKERAENLMIVDLIRNDLLAACRPESVKVEGLMKVETYETVHQLVTTVTGQLSSSASPVDLLKASFPPGSMTGAPKLRSVQLLDELEGREKRGVYSGVFGYLAIDGSSDWSVVIRTLVKRGHELTLGAGGAITHLSEPETEWEEVLTKVEAVTGGLKAGSS